MKTVILHSKKFLDKQDITVRIDIIAAIDEIIEWKNNDLILPKSKSKLIRNQIYELRVHHKNKISRSFYFFYKDKKIIFTNGFIKKSNKIPIQEIVKAEELREVYLLQNKGKV